MTPPTRPALDDVITRARASAFGPAEYIGQESFVTGTEVLTLARRAGINRGVSVLDLCCGTGGPGRWITERLGCRYLGVDVRRSAVEEARRRAAAARVRCRFEARRVPPLPPGRFDAVLLVETLLAFPERGALLGEVAAALPAGGRFALSAEVGRPLSPDEAAVMPDPETVTLTPLDELMADLARSGFRLRWQQEWTESHVRTAEALACAYERAEVDVPDGRERDAVDRLLAAHRLWVRWLADGRVRKYAMVAERCH